jgi:hypothetical protein
MYGCEHLRRHRPDRGVPGDRRCGCRWRITPADPCAAEVAVAEREVSAARVAAGHWREHVQARTALLDGRISQATTKAIWKRTRLAGPGDIRRMAAATAAYQPVRGGCANVPGAIGKACRQRLTALADAVVAGRGPRLAGPPGDDGHAQGRRDGRPARPDDVGSRLAHRTGQPDGLRRCRRHRGPNRLLPSRLNPVRSRRRRPTEKPD